MFFQETFKRKLLFHHHANAVLHDFFCTNQLRAFGHIHRRSQGGKGAVPPKFLAYLMIACFEKWCLKQNSVARLKSNILPPKKILGWLRHWVHHSRFRKQFDHRKANKIGRAGGIAKKWAR